jgi:hypothetical protein
MAPTLAERQTGLQEQLRTTRSRLADATTVAETLRIQCAQLEGALAIVNAMLTEDAPPTGNGPVQEGDPDAIREP